MYWKTRKKQYNTKKQQQMEQEAEVLEQLKQKDCYIMKADKVNKIVVMDKIEYDRRVWCLINENNHKEMKKSPLNIMKTAANDVRKEITKIFSERFKWRLLASNPKVLKLYCLPKIYKTGDKMTQIVALLNAKIAKWLVNKLKQYPQFESCATKNSAEFINSIQN